MSLSDRARRGLVAVLALAAIAGAVGLVVRQATGPGKAGPAAPAVATSAADPVQGEVPALDGPPMQIAPEDLQDAGRLRDDPVLGMKLVWCPPGTFHLGRLPDSMRRLESIRPVRVTLTRGFWIGQFEVTQSQWVRVMGRTLREQRALDPTQPRPVGDGTTREHVGAGPDHPIYFVSHADAEEFCRKLTERARTAGRLEPGWEYRLPTEAQWEFASRAGTTTATAFGDAMSSTQANFDGSHPEPGRSPGPYVRETTPAGHYPPNAWGIHDMHGNVWEWCRLDASTPVDERTTFPTRRVYRGGCWHNPYSLCLSTARGWGQVDDRGSGVGLRVALTAAEP